MTWNEFMERHDRWSGATLRSRIYALKEVGTNGEVIATVLELPEEKYKMQLIRKAIKLGNVFSKDEMATLKGALSPSAFREVFFGEEEPPQAPAEPESSAVTFDIPKEVCREQIKPKKRLFKKRNKVMDKLAALFGLPVPPKSRSLICGCAHDCDECPKKKSNSSK